MDHIHSRANFVQGIPRLDLELGKDQCNNGTKDDYYKSTK